MVFFTSIKKSMFVISLTYIALGLMLFMQDQFTFDQMFIVMTIGFLVTGLLVIFRYFMLSVTDRIKRNDFMVGAILVTFAILIYLYRFVLAEVFDLFGVFAIFMIVSCYFKLEDMFDAAACGKSAYSTYLLVIIITLIFAAVTYFANFNPVSIQLYICAIGLIFAGATDIISNFVLAVKVYQHEKNIKEVNTPQIKSELPEVIDEPYVEPVEAKEETTLVEEEKVEEVVEEVVEEEKKNDKKK